MSTRRENIQNQLKNNGRARTGLVIFGVVILVMVVFGILSLTKKEKPAITETSSLPAPPRIENVPGGSTDERYNELQRLENDRKAANARPGDTVLPTQVADTSQNANTPFLPERPVETPVAQEPVVQQPVVQQPVVQPPQQPVYQQAPEPVAPAQEPVPQAPAQPDPRALQARYEQTAKQLNNYLASWSTIPTGVQEFHYNGQKNVEGNASSGSGNGYGSTGNGGSGITSASSGYGSNNDGTSNKVKQASIVRAGTVIPAVLLSVINSDNQGPVLAQITTGPLAGTRFLGTFQNTDKALVLSFQTMTKPGMGTYQVSAVAVDEKYSVGMATDVDNHYFRRYGLLLAGSLLQGYGDAMGRANTTIVTGPFGTTTSQGELSDKQVAAVALGKVGGNMSQELIQQSRIKPTVHLDCKGGCPVGILFMSDL